MMRAWVTRSDRAPSSQERLRAWRLAMQAYRADASPVHVHASLIADKKGISRSSVLDAAKNAKHRF
jgi:hypothetical protein